MLPQECCVRSSACSGPNPLQTMRQRRRERKRGAKLRQAPRAKPGDEVQCNVAGVGVVTLTVPADATPGRTYTFEIDAPDTPLASQGEREAAVSDGRADGQGGLRRDPLACRLQGLGR